jgi:hypothetical protein
MQPPSLSGRAAGSVEDDPVFLHEQRVRVLEFIRAMRLDTLPIAGTMIAYHLGLADREGGAQAEASAGCVHPVLFLWSCKACGGDATVALPVAAGIELLHNFIEVHDDIQNEVQRRRDRETLWRVWGIAQAINTGDALHALAFQTLTSAAIDPERLVRVGSLISEALLQKIDAPPAESRAVLLAASMEAGAVVAGASDATADGFRRAGRLLGMKQQDADSVPTQAIEAVAVVENLGLDPVFTGVFRELANYIATTDG